MSVTKTLTPPDASLAAYSDAELQNIMDSLASEIGQGLARQGLMVRCAESCTGGAIARALTEMAGSSAWFDCAYVTYSNEAKIRLLGVDASLLDKHGAVSEPVARAMALGALGHDALAKDRRCVTVAVTGVAGPGGGSVEKPVGTVWFGWAGPSPEGPQARCTMVKFDGGRSAVRLQTAIYALKQLQTFWL